MTVRSIDPIARTLGGSVANPIQMLQAEITALTLVVATKAPLNSPTFVGIPNAPTASPGTNNTQIATTTYADAKVENVINAAHTTVAPSNSIVAATYLSQTNAAATYAPLNSPVLSNGVTINAASSPGFAIQSFSSAGSNRWLFFKDNAVESGSNAGSNFQINANNDAGSFLGVVLTIARSTQVVTFDQSPIVPTPTAGDSTQKAASTAFVAASFLPINNAVTTGTFTLAADPLSPFQAATKNYVDNVAAGVSPRANCLVGTTANITLSGEQTIDGVLTSASRVLVKNQTSAANNGIYVSASGAWSRSSDMNVWTEVPGANCYLSQGTTQAGSGWVCTSAAGGTLGTTAITFVPFGPSGAFVSTNNPVMTGTGTLNGSVIQTAATVAATYLTQANAASTYLTITTAASTYLTQTTASATYAPISNPTFNTFMNLNSASGATLAFSWQDNGVTFISQQMDSSNNYNFETYVVNGGTYTLSNSVNHTTGVQTFYQVPVAPTPGNSLLLSNPTSVATVGNLPFIEVLPQGSPSGDDSTAINAALSAISVAGGGTVQLMAANYYLQNPIIIGNNAVLQGAGIAGTFIHAGANLTAMLTQASLDHWIGNITVRDIYFDGNKSSYTTGSMFLLSVVGGIFTNNSLQSGSGSAATASVQNGMNIVNNNVTTFGLNVCWVNKIYANDFGGFTNSGSAAITGQMTDSEIFDNYISGNYNGIVFGGASQGGVKIYGNQIEVNSNAGLIFNVEDNSAYVSNPPFNQPAMSAPTAYLSPVTTNYFDQNGIALQLKNTGSAVCNCNVAIAANNFHNSGTDHVQLIGSFSFTGVSIVGNTFSAIGGRDTGYDVNFLPLCSQMTVTGNTHKKSYTSWYNNFPAETALLDAGGGVSVARSDYATFGSDLPSQGGIALSINGNYTGSNSQGGLAGQWSTSRTLIGGDALGVVGMNNGNGAYVGVIDGATTTAAAFAINFRGGVAINVTNGSVAFSKPVVFQTYTFATLPGAGLSAAWGTYCTNACALTSTVTAGVVQTQGTGSGTGALVTYNGSVWQLAGTNISASA